MRFSPNNQLRKLRCILLRPAASVALFCSYYVLCFVHLIRFISRTCSGPVVIVSEAAATTALYSKLGRNAVLLSLSALTYRVLTSCSV